MVLLTSLESRALQEGTTWLQHHWKDLVRAPKDAVEGYVLPPEQQSRNAQDRGLPDCHYARLSASSGILTLLGKIVFTGGLVGLDALIRQTSMEDTALQHTDKAAVLSSLSVVYGMIEHPTRLWYMQRTGTPMRGWIPAVSHRTYERIRVQHYVRKNKR